MVNKTYFIALLTVYAEPNLKRAHN